MAAPPTEPPHNDPREVMLRQELNLFGYQSVHFKIEGDTIWLWGTADSEADNITVQMLARATGVTSLEDHIKVSDTFAEP